MNFTSRKRQAMEHAQPLSAIPTVHKSGNKTTPFFFEPYIKDSAFVGHLLKIDGVGIAFNLVETIKLREYLKLALSSLYS